MKKIIVVDDYKDFADVVREYIESKTKQKCIAFYDSVEALKNINNEKDIDVLVTDYQMPKMDGFELAKEVIRKFPNMKIVIWSGHGRITLEEIKRKHNLGDEIKVLKLAYLLPESFNL